MAWEAKGGVRGGNRTTFAFLFPFTNNVLADELVWGKRGRGNVRGTWGCLYVPHNKSLRGPKKTRITGSGVCGVFLTRCRRVFRVRASFYLVRTPNMPGGDPTTQQSIFMRRISKAYHTLKYTTPPQFSCNMAFVSFFLRVVLQCLYVSWCWTYLITWYSCHIKPRMEGGSEDSLQCVRVCKESSPARIVAN